VLDFGRLEQNRKQYQISRFDLREAVEESLQSQRIRLGEAGMELSVELPNAPVPIESDRDAVKQALLNLIDNAVKYAASGKKLHVVLETDSGGYSISVADAGQGISPAHRHRIFERFYRIDDSITAKSQGSGLGLGLSRRLLIDLGGTLEYRPVESGGACFVVTLPGVDAQ
jgi:signal transduction histidine kinase